MQKKCSATSMVWNDAVIHIYFGLTIPARLVWDKHALSFSRLHRVLSEHVQGFLFWTEEHFGIPWFCKLLFLALRCQLAFVQVSGHIVKNASPYTASPLPWWLTFIKKVQLISCGNTHFCWMGPLAFQLQLCLVQHTLPCLKIYEVIQLDHASGSAEENRVNKQWIHPGQAHTVSITLADAYNYFPCGVTSKANLLRLAS